MPERECENCKESFNETPETKDLSIFNLQFCSEACLDAFVTIDAPDEDEENEEFEDEDEYI